CRCQFPQSLFDFGCKMIGQPHQVDEEAGASIGEYATEVLCDCAQASERFRPESRGLLPHHLKQPFAFFARENTDRRDAGRHDRCDSIVFFPLTEPWVWRQSAPAHRSAETEAI